MGQSLMAREALPGKLRLVYIGGYGRSGSTVLSLLLGRHPSVLSIGEFDNFSEWYSQNDTCGCGTPVRSCPLWEQVVDETGSHSASSVSFVMGSKLKSFRLAFSHMFGHALSEEDSQTARLNYKLLRNALGVSGKQIVLDASKHFGRLYAMLSSGLFDVKIIHVIRDGRGVGFSKKKKHKLTMMRHFAMQRPRSVGFTTRRWAASNMMMFLSRFFVQNDSYMLLRYEDFASDPDAAFRRIFNFLNIGECDLILAETATHTIGGNDLRLAPVKEIKLDDKWKKSLTLRDRLQFIINGGPVVNLIARVLARRDKANHDADTSNG